ncbi:MAG TPA: peptidase M16, partial [Thalassospira sp.]|nr:peptidase M16 [Thalassospira sp.]
MRFSGTFRSKMRTPILAIALAAITVFFAPASSYAAVFNPQTATLDNGMQVVLVENHRAPVVTHMVWYKVGSADEPQGVSGIAHFLEHLMFKGTDDIAPGDFSKIVARNGGNDNAFTSWDYTGYFQNIARDR